MNPVRYSHKQEENLYFVMDRFTPSNEAFWNSFSHRQQKAAGKLYAQENDTTLAGTIGFSNALLCSLIFARTVAHEVWILYASTKDVPDKQLPNIDSLEMTCTVSTSQDVPFTTHMGVSRTIGGAGKVHPHLSPRLHAFGAKIMLNLYPAKLYMITTPMPIMEAIFKKVLGEQNVHVALEQDWQRYIEESQNSQDPDAPKIIQYYKDRIAACKPYPVITVGQHESSYTIKDLNQKTILSLTKEEMDTTHRWYFTRETTFSGRNNIIAIPLQVLASSDLTKST